MQRFYIGCLFGLALILVFSAPVACAQLVVTESSSVAQTTKDKCLSLLSRGEYAKAKSLAEEGLRNDPTNSELQETLVLLCEFSLVSSCGLG